MGDRLGIQVAVDILEFSYISTQKHYYGVIMLMSYQDRRLSCFINIQNLLIKIYHLVWQNSPFTSLWQQKLPCPRWGSNSRPSDYETDALPTALRRLVRCLCESSPCEMVISKDSLQNFLSEVGFEPTPSSEDQKSPLIPYLGTRFKPWVWRLRPLGHPDMLDLLAVCKS